MSKIKDRHRENPFDSNRTEYNNRAHPKPMDNSLSKGEIAKCFNQPNRGIKNHREQV
jgi:hypothetical protein